MFKSGKDQSINWARYSDFGFVFRFDFDAISQKKKKMESFQRTWRRKRRRRSDPGYREHTVCPVHIPRPLIYFTVTGHLICISRSEGSIRWPTRREAMSPEPVSKQLHFVLHRGGHIRRPRRSSACFYWDWCVEPETIIFAYWRVGQAGWDVNGWKRWTAFLNQMGLRAEA